MNLRKGPDGVENVEVPPGPSFSQEVTLGPVPGYGIGCPLFTSFFVLVSQILTTVRATPVKMAALASMGSTPTSASVVTAGRGPTVKPVSVWSFWARRLGDSGGNPHGKLVFFMGMRP